MSKLSKLSILNLSHNKIKSLPDSIFNLANLYNLQMENNLLVELSMKICQLNKLTCLNIKSNKITLLPKTIIQCEKLDDFTYDEDLIESNPIQSN